MPARWTAAWLICGMTLAAAAAPPEEPAKPVPRIVLDESASRWVLDRFAGCSTAGSDFLQGPARQAGGLGRPAVEPAPDGSVFLGVGMQKWTKNKIVRVTKDGALRLIAGGGSSLADAPARRAKIAVSPRGAGLVRNPADGGLYFVHPTIPAVRRLIRKDEQWRVETVAGDPRKAGDADGPAASARFAAPRSLAITSTGVVYVLDGEKGIRKIEKGAVSTLARFPRGPTVVDGPLATANMAITDMSGQICLGENDETIYAADHWHFAVRKIDLKTKTISTVALSENRPYHKGSRPRGADGPALTHARFVSGVAFVCWDPAHKALWVGGPDETRLRWLRDGWVKTVLNFGRSFRWAQDALGVKPEQMRMSWVHVRAVDEKGRAYVVAGSSKTGCWRAEEKGGDR